MSPPTTIFEAGDLVGGRYRILAFIASGGVAEVYEAEDQELRHHLALKALRRDRARASERFKREINLARQVTHPNVCRIYDLGSHGDVLFLTMELLAGETLQQHVERAGPLRPAAALPLVRQMAAGLEAAHKAGIVHRDFKSGNVMLVPAEEEEEGLRAVITDFGLARATAGDDRDPRVTAEDALVGTPAYMAPEQVEGGPITPAVDLYAFGVVLYEMLTGRYPFHGESVLATAVLRLTEEPPRPSVHVPDLDGRWERAVLRCLARRAGDRFASAGELVAALEGEPPQTAPPADEGLPGAVRDAARPRPRRRALGRPPLIAVAALLAALLVAGWWASRRGPTGPAPAAAAARPTVALLGFKNLSGLEEAEWLSTALAEMLAAEIAAGEDVRVIPGENVAEAKIELGLEETDSLPPGTLSRVGGLLGSDLVVTGSYLVAGAAPDKDVRLDLRVRRPATGDTVTRLSQRGTEAEVLDLVERAGRDLRDALGLAALTAAEAEAVRARRPSGTEAARLYAQGLEKARVYNAKAALELLQAAAESDPGNPLIHSALSSAWATLGYMPRARAEARRALDLAGGLSRRDRLWVEARYHGIAGDREQAVVNYRLLWDFYPDNLDYGLRLARAQISVSQAEAALATVERLRGLPSAARADPRIDLAEAEAARALSQYERQQTLAARAAAKGEALGARLMVARARQVEAGAWRDLGEPEKAVAAYEEAMAIYAAANNRGPVARILIALAILERHRGRFDEARTLIDEALAVAREIGDQGSVRQALNTLAIMLRQQGKLSDALAMHEMELETLREIGESRSLQIALTSLGMAQREMADLEGAKARFEEALQLAREAGNQRGVEINLNLLGDVLLRQGHLREAKRHFEEALAANQKTGTRRGRAYYVSALGEVDMLMGKLAAARQKHEEALAIRRSLGENTNVAFSQLALAALALEESRPQEAAALAVAAAEEYRRESKPGSEAYALAQLARARLALGDTAAATAAVERATELVAATQNRGTRLQVALRAAEVAAAAGKSAEARRQLREIVGEAKELGFVDLRLAAELALGGLEADPARLAAVAEEASARGFRLLADKAAASAPKRVPASRARSAPPGSFRR